jgi:hypothetical protein
MTFWQDTLERFGATLVEAFCGGTLTAVVLDNVGILHLTDAKQAILVGTSTAVIAALSFLKALAARFLGSKDSASLIE